MTITVPSNQWRLASEGGVPVRVVSRSGTFESNESTATETFIIRGNQLMAFALESFPPPIYVGGLFYYPRSRSMTSLPALITKRISWKSAVDGKPIDPFGNDPSAPNNTYEGDVEVTIEYGTSPGNDTPPDPDDPSTFLQITANASGEFLVLPAAFANMTWADFPGIPITRPDIPHTITQSLVEWNAHWSQIPYDYLTDILVAKLRDKLGKVNSGVMPLFYDAPANTIMFTGYTISQQYTWREGYTGKSPVEMDFKFFEKNFESGGVSVTHQHIYRPGGGWDRLLLNGDPLYDSTDLDNLFK